MIKYDMLLLKHVTSNPYLPLYTIQLPWCLIYSWHVESSQCLVFLLNLMIVLTFLVCLLVHTSNFEQGNGGKVGVLWDGTRQREKGVLDTAGGITSFTSWVENELMNLEHGLQGLWFPSIFRIRTCDLIKEPNLLATRPTLDWHLVAEMGWTWVEMATSTS